MRTRFILTTLTLVVLVLATIPSLEQTTAAQRPTRFTSTYTSLINCPSGMTRKEEREAEERGSDIPSKCKGPGGYVVFVGYSACSAHLTLDKGEESTPLLTQSVDFKQKTVEFRLANGKPFAVIARYYEYEGDENCATGGKIKGETLIVRGLKGYEHIEGEINVRGTKNPNLKARQLADEGYAKAP